MSFRVEDVHHAVDKVVVGGAAGGVLSLTLSDWNMIVAIAVGCVTFLYVGYKLITAIIDRHQEKKASETRK